MLHRAIVRWETHKELLATFQQRAERAPVALADFEKFMLEVCIGFECERNGFDTEMSPNRVADNLAYLGICFQAEDGEMGNEFLERCFFVALCCALNAGENRLKPADALRLGLIDTVRTDISKFRQFRPVWR